MKQNDRKFVFVIFRVIASLSAYRLTMLPLYSNHYSTTFMEFTYINSFIVFVIS